MKLPVHHLLGEPNATELDIQPFEARQDGFHGAQGRDEFTDASAGAAVGLDGSPYAFRVGRKRAGEEARIGRLRRLAASQSCPGVRHEKDSDSDRETLPALYDL